MKSIKQGIFLRNPAILQSCIRTVTVNATAVQENENVEKQKPLKSWKEIPGPPSLPIIGQLHNFLPGGSLYDAGMHMWEKLYTYGPITRIDGFLGKTPMLYLFDPDSIEQIYRSENRMPMRHGFETLEYYGRQKNVSNGDPDGPTGLITSNGEIWKKFRSAVNPVMLQPKTIELYKTRIEEVADDMVERIRTVRDDKTIMEEKFDLLMNLWALESIGLVALGGRLNCFDPNLHEDSPAQKLIKCVTELLPAMEELEFNQSFGNIMSTKASRKVIKLYEEQETLAKYFIDKARTEFSSNKKPNEEKSVLEKLLEIDERIAIIMACEMLLAGIDTTSNQVTATLYYLGTNKDKQEKLREELKTNPEKKTYLKACVKEAFRMMPVVAGNMRTITKEYHLLGYRVPKGTRVMFCHMYMSMQEKYFPRPEEFLPERWIAEKDDPLYYGKAHNFSYKPFGFGVRSCVGRRIAEQEMETIVGKLIENFDVEWTGPRPKVHLTMVNYVKGPYRFTFRDIEK